MPKSIAGIVPILAAPFTDSGALDEDSFQSLVRHLLNTGASALTLFGLATEFYKEHHTRVIGAVRLPVIVQYAPVQTGVRLSPDVFLRLRDALLNAD